MKTVVVTGGTRGIGRALVKLLARSGYAVAFTYNNSDDTAAQLVSELNGNGCCVCAYKADNADSARLKQVANDILAQFGGVYALVNNAGYSVISPLCDTSDEDICRTLDVNLKGAITLTKAFYLAMASAHEGKIVNVSSVWGRFGASCESVYSASKGGLIAFTKAMAKELALSGITVNCICPGVIDTDMNAHLSQDEKSQLISEIPLGREGKPEEVAECIKFLIDGADYITGQIIGIDGGFAQ